MSRLGVNRGRSMHAGQLRYRHGLDSATRMLRALVKILSTLHFFGGALRIVQAVVPIRSGPSVMTNPSHTFTWTSSFRSNAIMRLYS